MTGPEARPKQLGIELPGVLPAVGNYLSAKLDSDRVYLSRHGPVKVDREGLIPGMRSREISVQDALGAIIRVRSAARSH